MSQWEAQREWFRQLVVAQGITLPSEINTALPLGYEIPGIKLEKWLRRLRAVPKRAIEQKRYINRFKIGADPEFVFAGDAGAGAGLIQVPGNQLGLKQGPAFGADNNGRLVEIRPHPSRSVLAVTASLLTTLRWLALIHPSTMKYQWQAGAFLYGDGLGGHVHFGRKRPTRTEEIRALDLTSDFLTALDMFPTREVLRRRQGDQRNQIYGRNGDYRLQMHGYEYRTWPSWLDSPALAFVTMTLSKLAVYNPRLIMGMQLAPDYHKNMHKMQNFLAYYKDVDDDARLAYWIVRRGLPRHIGGDFRNRWGLMGLENLRVENVTVIPSSIKPDEEDVRELEAHLKEGIALKARVPKPTWSPTVPPDRYQMCLSMTDTTGVKGLGELIWDLTVHSHIPMKIIGSHAREARPLTLSSGLKQYLPVGWEAIMEDIDWAWADDWKPWISIDPRWREGAKGKKVRKILTSGVFPVWKISQIKPGSLDEWMQKKPQGRVNTFRGSVVYQSREVV